jgi:urease accessory protein
VTRSILALISVFAVMAGPAFAHSGAASVSGLSAGFWHPLSGPDHILAMVAVGILAAQTGGRALWLAPVAFIAAMAAGAGLGIAGVAVPLVEPGIAGSVVILGAVIAAGRRLTPAAAMGLVAALAVFHGHAHGAEMPATASVLAYGLGFAAATALLHGTGIGLAMAARTPGERAARLVLRTGGGALAAAGMAMVALQAASA